MCVCVHACICACKCGVGKCPCGFVCVCIRGVRRLIYGNKCPVSDPYHLDQLVFYDYHETGRTQHSKITMRITGVCRAERG